MFGIVADRYGRTRALISSILIYSVFTAACGLAQTVAQLAVFRVFLGLGMGGEWASGAALVSETWPAEHRGKALGFMQSAWAVGYGAGRARRGRRHADLGLARGVLRRRAAGAADGLGAAAGRGAGHLARAAGRRRRPRAAGSADVFRGDLLRLTVAVTLMNACTMFAWWGFNQWIPAYLSLPGRGGRHRPRARARCRASSSPCRWACGSAT